MTKKQIKSWIWIQKELNKKGILQNWKYQLLKKDGFDFFIPIAMSKRKYISLEELKVFIKSLKIKSKSEWYDYCRNNDIPINIPNNPYSHYKNKGWISWYNLFGMSKYESNNIKGKKVSCSRGWNDRLPFDEAKKFVQTLKLKSVCEWQIYSKTKRSSNIPADPRIFYRKEWTNWYDFLGIDKGKSNRIRYKKGWITRKQNEYNSKS